jgi:glycosyltransferase involved in cell wall biosynthesis
MRVLHLNTHSSGGSYEQAALLSSALTEQGIESRVLCKYSKPIESAGPLMDRILRRSYVSLSIEPWHGTRRLLSAPGAEELDGIDVVHLHTVADWFNVPNWLETLPGRIGVVVGLHDMWHFTGGCFLYRGCYLYSDSCAPCPILKPPFNRLLAKDEQRRKAQAYRNRQVRFVANSQWLAELAERSSIVAGCSGTRVITPGIDTDVFTPRNKIQCRIELGLPANAFMIAAGAASLTDKNKNVSWLLKQLARLSELKDLLVVLMGDGAIEVPGGLNVQLLGNIADSRRRAMFFGAADVFVSASLMETYGLTLVEAMASRTPVVAFRTGGISEAVLDGKAGILCDLLDGAAFQSAIKKLSKSSELRDELGATASKLVLARNDKARFAMEFVRLYKDCLSVAKTPSANQGSQSSHLPLHSKDAMESRALRRH